MGWMNDSHFTSDPRLAYMSGDVRYRWQPENDFRFRRWTPAEFELHHSLFAADKQMVGIMFCAGVPLLTFCFPGFSLHDDQRQAPLRQRQAALRPCLLLLEIAREPDYPARNRLRLAGIIGEVRR
jgi:hypothetical protein